MNGPDDFDLAAFLSASYLAFFQAFPSGLVQTAVIVQLPLPTGFVLLTLNIRLGHDLQLLERLRQQGMPQRGRQRSWIYFLPVTQKVKPAVRRADELIGALVELRQFQDMEFHVFGKREAGRLLQKPKMQVMFRRLGKSA